MSQNLEDDVVTNTSGNRPFEEVLRAQLSRRGVLAGGAATMAATFLAGTGVADAAVAVANGKGQNQGRGKPAPAGLTPSGSDEIGFTALPNALATGPVPSISEDYEYSVVFPWGTAIQPGGPEFSWPQTSAADQEAQVGIGHDGMWFFADKRNGGLLCMNHEFGRTTHVLGKAAPESLEDVRIMQAAHGVSVLRIAQDGNGNWERIRSSRNRRITVNTPVTFDGPVAKSGLLDTPAGNAPQGTLNNCANGYTPWGTYLTCEENFNGYFGASAGDDFVPTEEQDRYGFTSTGFGYDWWKFDGRFDLSNTDYTNEENRFGWIVEIDPRVPGMKPVKHTALGRFKHEGIALTTGKDGRMVGYMGDDQRFDYIYKFVSEADANTMRHRGKSPLESGRLFVARFDATGGDDEWLGTGEWLELTIDNPELAARFDSQEEVLTYARVAADILGATPMDRPEWTTVGPDGSVFCTLTNNTRRTEPNAANPQAPNSDGHIIKWMDADDHVGTTFQWTIVILASESRGTGYDFTDPDGLWADPDGRLFIQTDGGQPTVDGTEDGAQLNNQMLVMNGDGVIKRLFAGVTDDEITGVAVTPDRTTMFVNIQHPGNGDPEATNFPAAQGSGAVPRDTTIAIRRKDGGIVGS